MLGFLVLWMLCDRGGCTSLAMEWQMGMQLFCTSFLLCSQGAATKREPTSTQKNNCNLYLKTVAADSISESKKISLVYSSFELQKILELFVVVLLLLIL
jgi:hypothetical protein